MELLTFTDAAQIAGCNSSTLRYAVKQGHLSAQKFGKTWLITREELERWRNTPELHKPGVKAK